MTTTARIEESTPSSAASGSPALSGATMLAVSCAVLILEVSLTRVFSFVMWYHLTYLVISLALLGYGAAGTLLSTEPRLATADYRRTIARACMLFSVLTVMAVAVAVRVPSDPEGLFEGHTKEILRLVATHLTLAVPFFFAGTAIGFVLMRNKERTNRLYAADLCGAGLGSFIAVVAINRLGAVCAIFLAATLPALAALAASWKDRLADKITSGLLVVLLAGCSALSVSHDLLRLKISRGKDLTPRQDQIIYTAWNIVGRVDVTTPIFERAHFGVRISDAYQGPLPWVLPIFQDATAPTALVHVNGRAEDYPLLDYYLQGAPYAVRRRPRSVLIIGIGGGIDALIAEHAGARRIVGVDVNPTMIELLERRYRDFASGVFQGGDLELVASEGRHYLTRSGEKFDVIQLSGVDTFAALSTGAFVLTENYLYTVEAVMDLVHHLNEDGVLSYSRWLFSPPRETLKLVVTSCEALKKMGFKDAPEHFFIVAGGPASGRWADTMVKKTPFTQPEIQALRSWARARKFDVIFDPAEPASNPFNTYLRSPESEQRTFITAYLYDVSPSRDDRPFFFQFYRWRDVLRPSAVRGEGGYAPVKMPKGLLSLVLSLIEATVFSVAFILLPLKSKKGLGLTPGPWAGWLAAFAGLGLGFIFIEIVLIQKLSVFLGGPAYSLALTLFALLVFSGLGSRLSERLATSSVTVTARMIALLLGVQILEIFFLDFGVPALLVLPQLGRRVIGVLAIAPLGLLLGIPFPTLLAKAGKASTALVPWAWGVNACATVIGSVLATMLSLEFGFNLTWLLAMGMYFALFLLVAIRLREDEALAGL